MELYTGNRWELIDQACRLAERREDEERGRDIQRDSFGNYDPPDQYLDYLDDRR